MSAVSWCPAEENKESSNGRLGGIQVDPRAHMFPHPWAWREDEAASCGPELGSCSLGAAGHGAGGGGLDVNIELSRLLVVKIRITRGEAWGLGPTWVTVKGPTLNLTTLLPPRGLSCIACPGSYLGSFYSATKPQHWCPFSRMLPWISPLQRSSVSSLCLSLS